MGYLDEEIAGGKRLPEPASNVIALNAAEDAVVDAIEATHAGFWRMGELPPDLPGRLEPPEANAMLARRLGPFPFWRGETDFWQALERMYRTVSSNSLKSFDSVAGNTKRPREK